MPITIKHGAELEGKALAYGAASKAAYIQQQQEEQEKEQKKAGKLGDIGSVLGMAGAAASFIPGLQPVGIGLSVAGGALGRLSGGQGTPALQVAATAAQGISSVYQAQREKVQARQEDMADWKARHDYTSELSSLKKQENLDQEIRVRDQEFIQQHRSDSKAYTTKRNAVLEAVNLSAFKSFSLEAMDIALLDNKGPQGNAYKQIKEKLYDLEIEHQSNVQGLIQARENDPATTVEQANKQRAEAAKSEQARLEKEAVRIAKQEKIAVTQAKDRATTIRTNSNLVADIEAELSKSEALDDDDPKRLNEAAYDAKVQQSNIAAAAVNRAIAKEVQIEEVRLANGDPDAMAEGVESWVQRRTEELIVKNKARVEKYISEEQWDAQLGGISLYHEGIARLEIERLLEESPASVMREFAELSTNVKFGLL